MQLTQPLHQARLEQPDATALVCGQRRSSFAALADRVARLAMLGHNSDHCGVIFYAVWCAGEVINPVNMRWSARAIAYSLDDCATRILLVDDNFHSTVAGLRSLSHGLRNLMHWGNGAAPEGVNRLDGPLLAAQTQPIADADPGSQDLAAVMYTGGTTGRPKGVMLTHANLVLNLLAANQAATRPLDVAGITIAPIFHVGGMGLVLQRMQRLCRQDILPGFDELALLQAIADEWGNEPFLVPTMLRRLVEHPRFAEFDTSALPLVLYGAAPIDGSLPAQAQRALPAAGFCQLCGMTELSPVVTALPAWCHAPGQPVVSGVVGEIASRGPCVMAGDWNQPEQIAAAVQDGWMHTGDSGWMDVDGFVYAVDRRKDMSVTGGENLHSAEVENAFALLPAVSLVAVIGVPDDRWGERVHAVVVPRAGLALDADALIADCREQIAGYKCPRSVKFRSALPLSAAGKALKHGLRAPFWAGRSRAVH